MNIIHLFLATYNFQNLLFSMQKGSLAKHISLYKRCRLITIDWKIVVLTTECLGHCSWNNNDYSSSNERIMPYSIVLDPKRLSIAFLFFMCNCYTKSCTNRWESVSTWFFKSFHEWSKKSLKTPFAVTSQVLSLFECNLNFLFASPGVKDHPR